MGRVGAGPLGRPLGLDPLEHADAGTFGPSCNVQQYVSLYKSMQGYVLLAVLFMDWSHLGRVGAGPLGRPLGLDPLEHADAGTFGSSCNVQCYESLYNFM